MENAVPTYRIQLREAFGKKLQSRPGYSLRAFARSLEVDASALSRILSGKQVPSPKLARKLTSKLAFTPAEQKLFFQSLAESWVAKIPTAALPGAEPAEALS